MFIPKKFEVDLPNDIYKLLVKYYNNAYKITFVLVTDLVKSRAFKNETSDQLIIVISNVNQFGCI